ncbi:MAG: PEP-CTERM sorting domain-containing protein [Phycisphaerae bacterium]
MHRHTYRFLAAAAVVLATAATVHAGPLRRTEFTVAWSPGIDAMPTADTGEALAVYLGSNPMTALSDIDPATLAGSMGREDLASMPQFVPDMPTVHTYSAPAVPAPLPPGPPAAPARLASFAYPEAAKGLSDLGSGGRDVPLGDARYFNTAPGAYGTVLSGRPPGGLENWSHVTRTAISYIRPNVNVQMMLALDVRGNPGLAEFEGPGFEPKALLAIDRNTELESSDIGAQTAQFGRRARPDPTGEPQTAVTAGLDLGLLPTFLAQMGMGVAVVASRGQESGDLRVALVGTTELPVDWTPIERPYQHPTGQGAPILAMRSPWLYPSGGVSEGGGGGGGEGGGGAEITPITPTPIPEPATLLILGAGAAAILAARRKRRA